MRRLFFVVLSILLANSTALALTVTLNPVGTSYVRSQASDGSTINNDTLYPTTLPYPNSHSVTQGGSSSSTDYDLSDASFEITMEHERETANNAHGLSLAFIYFTVDQNVDYLLEGVYTAVDAAGRSIVQLASLYDNTDSSSSFYGRQESDHTPNESFTLGLAEGDNSNSVSCCLTGTLLAGHEYLFHYYNIVNAAAGSPSAATADGYVRLTFVPEPSTALLLAGGLAGLAAAGRRRSRH
jgi:hypothetical protein